MRRKLEGVLGSQFMVLCPTELSGCFIWLVQRNSGMLCEYRPRLIHFIIPTASYRTFNTTNSKSGCCTRSVSHPNKLCKNDLNVIFHLLSVPNGRFEIRFPTKTLYREARKSSVQTFVISLTCQDISLLLCCETSVFLAMLVASTVVTVKCAVTPSDWLIPTDVSEEPAFIIRVMDSSVHI